MAHITVRVLFPDLVARRSYS